MCILYLTHGRLWRHTYCMWESGMPWMRQERTRPAVRPHVEHVAPAGNAVSLQRAARRPSVPAKLLQSRRCQKLNFFFSFPHTNPVSDRGRTPGSWFSKAPEVRDWLASSTSEVHWHQQVYSRLKGILVSQEISRCCTSPFAPWSGPYKARFLMSTETMPTHPVFSSRSLAKMCTLVLLLVPWAHVQINLPGALISGCSLSSFPYRLTKLSNPPDFALSMQWCPSHSIITKQALLPLIRNTTGLEK